MADDFLAAAHNKLVLLGERLSEIRIRVDLWVLLPCESMICSLIFCHRYQNDKGVLDLRNIYDEDLF